ncbi:MAG: glutamate--tRNA ligase [Bacilli bacterium]|nr:glutamate--tRNA ligase [Bacilli bacterium]
MKVKTRTRYAPSPTGFMHVGNLRSAIFEYLLARHNQGDFILRIEDTDQTRKVEGAVDFIYDTCRLCGLDFDEGPRNPGAYGPYTQSERLAIYQKYAHELVEKGHAYYCFCTSDRLDKLRQQADENKVAFQYDGHCKNLSIAEVEEKIKAGIPYVIRQKMPTTGVSVYEDLVYGKISVENRILEDQILLKSDGYPTYNFANVIDDHLMGITHVARGNEYVMSTPKYNLLYEAFGWEKPVYVHLPMVNGADGKKLSKRNGDASFMDLYKEGYLPAAIVNYLAMLGWSPATNDEIFTLDELVEIFDPRRISKAPAVFDLKKLQWFNAHYIKKLPLEALLEITVPHLQAAYDLSQKEENWVKELVSLYQNHISYGKEIASEAALFFQDETDWDQECQAFMEEETIPKTLAVFTQCLEQISDWTVENIKQAINDTKEQAGVKGKLLFMPIRIQVSGQMHGPELPNTIHLLGKETVLKRLKSSKN